MRWHHWIGAWAIGLALLAAGGPSAQTPERERMPHPGPSVEAETQREANRGGRPPEPPPVPVRIIQSVDETEHDATREAKSDEHDAKDLDAQKRAANAAEKQILPTRVAVGLTAFGTCLLVWTLYETRRTANAAVEGIKAAKRSADAAIAAQRPWIRGSLSIEMPIFVGADSVQLNATVELENVGNSPATLPDMIDVAGFVCVYPYNPFWAQQAALKKIDRKWYNSTEKGGLAIFPRCTKVFRPMQWSEDILPAVQPDGLDIPAPHDWPFTDDDLVIFVMVGIDYTFIGGDGRTEFSYVVAYHPARSPDAGRLTRGLGVIQPGDIVCTRFDIGDTAR